MELPCQTSKAKIAERMGEPDQKDANEGKEVWRYGNGLKWRGILVSLLIIPVPVVVPIGRDEHTFLFEGDFCRLEVFERDLAERAFMCGWMMRNEGEGTKLRCGFD